MCIINFQLNGCQTVEVGASLWRGDDGVMAARIQVYVNVTDNANGRSTISRLQIIISAGFQ